MSWNQNSIYRSRNSPRVVLTPMLLRQLRLFAAWSCPRLGQGRYTRRPSSRRLPSCQVPATRLRVQAFNAANPSSTATDPQAARAADPAAIRNALLAVLPERPASSPAADRVQSTPRAQPPAAMPALVEPAHLARVPALALVPGLADHRAPASERVPEQAEQRRQLVKLHARSARPTNAPAAALRSTPRPKKAP